jgi:hypothetical protein
MYQDKKIVRYILYSYLAYYFKEKKYKFKNDSWYDENDKEIVLPYYQYVDSAKKNCLRNREFYNPNTKIKFNVFYFKNEAIISFRGTADSLVAWINNFIFFHKKWSDISIVDKDTSLKTEIFSFYSKFKDKDQTIIKSIQNSKLIKSFKNDIKLNTNNIIKTNNEKLIMLDCDFKLNSSKMYFHQGLITLFSSIVNDVDLIIKEIKNENKGCKIVFTGHSLGGSLARIANFVFSLRYLNYFDDLISYSYGCFKMGNKTVEDFILNNMSNKFYNIYVKDDIVPTLPPDSLGFRKPLVNNIEIVPNHQLKMKNNPFNHRPIVYLDFLLN